MNSIKKLLMVMTLLLSVTFASAQIKNKTTQTVKINGNCAMCKKTIETAANVDNVAKVNWNKDTKIATITYDSKKTNPDAILKRVADAGYDNERFTAPTAVYDELHGCCQYDRDASPKKAE
ncbi:heavy-metal-associated domain-containing protein [Flavobacterium sp.]|uniref:heavy-metal-associated domain-containing protein n=1 Tax=Flavobacterium sp. TaxID=239 RepID=UPI003D0F7AEA